MRLWRLTRAGQTTLDGAGTVKHGDGLLGVEAVVNSPVGLSLDSQGYLYICERGENKIRRVKLY